MSLSSAIYAGNSGLIADSAAINVIGNNLANQNTIGFKSAQTIFSTMLSNSIGHNSQIGLGVQVSAVENQFSNGTLETTQNTTDLAIQGSGFFALAAPSASSTTAVTPTTAYYTQAGSFTVSASHELVNSDGYQVLDASGTPIVFAAKDSTGNYSFSGVSGISSTGAISCVYTNSAGVAQTLYYAGNGNVPTTAAPSSLYNLAEVTIPDPQGLQIGGGTMFSLTSSSGTPSLSSSAPAGSVFNSANGTTESILSDHLEESNVDLGSEMVNLINVQSAYSANSKTITTANEMAQDLFNLIR